ncbi:hypothetical protein [Bradyrhizobium manausense]|uniref:Uncharacterized protein n=1 Tax=Bradyrhizobium manausense TaxID=989370 RepID=A0A0R3CR33_9BRAD|nr:hypothetical protein [Bradyrhizobium manausense]KRQ00192.1 hypothetical protein AOQ71_41390 [Bradyrhizobium manausense]
MQNDVSSIILYFQRINPTTSSELTPCGRLLRTDRCCDLRDYEGDLLQPDPTLTSVDDIRVILVDWGRTSPVIPGHAQA